MTYIVTIDDRTKNVCIHTLEEHCFSFFGKPLCVPKFYQSDGFSCPHFLYGLISPHLNENTLIPAIEHDFLYETKQGFFKANVFFLIQLLKSGFGIVKSVLSFLGVMLCGYSHY